MTVTLAVSGMLWNRSLVMIDAETGSLWSHLLGRAMSGPLEGTDLERLTGLMTNWKTWRELHPETTVLSLERTVRRYKSDLVFGEPGQFVVALAEGDAARAWPFDQLVKQPLVNDQFANKPVVVRFDRESFTPFVFERQLGDQTLTFESRGETIVDRETGSVWNLQSGKAISGSLVGEQLKPRAGIVSFRRAWKVFHPKTEEFTATR